MKSLDNLSKLFGNAWSPDETKRKAIMAELIKGLLQVFGGEQLTVGYSL